MPSIIASIPHPGDATALYRAIAPLYALKRSGECGPMDFVLNPDLNWMVLKGADLAFFQRPHLDDRLVAMKMCRAHNKKIWIDYDDNLHAVPMCNRRFSTYGHPHIQHNIATMVAMADVVTVTTQHLADSLARILKSFPVAPEYRLDPSKILLIPNAYDAELHGAMPEARGERAKRVVWRGSDSHCKDLMLNTPALVEVVKGHQDWSFEFIGEPFWGTVEELKKVARPGILELTAPTDPVAFFRYLVKQRPTLMIVPLEEIEFNKSKSNIAWIEATVAGAVTIAPDWPEWRMPGVLNYSGETGFRDVLDSALNGAFDLDVLWHQSRDYILENLQLGYLNAMRAGIVRRLCGG